MTLLSGQRTLNDPTGGKGTFVAWENVKNHGATGDGVTDDTTAIDAASTAARAAGKPLYFPEGTFVYNGSGVYGHPVRGAGEDVTTVALGAGKALIVSAPGPAATTSLDVKDIRTTGGFGMIRLTYTGSMSSAASFVVERFRCESFTGAAISSLASDQPYWKIKGMVYNAASTGIGVALSGLTDACDIDVDYQGVLIGVKLGAGGNNAHVRGSWVGLGAYAAPRVPIWIVPQTSATNAGQGFTVEQFRFGNEAYDSRDYRVLYADEDTTTGSDFASRTPNYSADSTGYVIGHVIRDCMVNGAGAAPAGPVVYSTTPNVRGCEYEVTLVGTMPDYVLKYRTAPAADWTNHTNKIRVHLPATDTPSTAVRPSNGKGVAFLIDVDGQLSRYQESPLAYPGGSDPAGSVTLVTATPATVVGATKTAITDALGGTDAAEVTYTNNTTDALYTTVTAANVVVGLPMWIECDLKQGSASSLTDVEVRFRYASGAKHAARYLPLTSRWVRHRFMFVPREAASNFQLTFWAHNESAGKAQIGRVRVYQAREPLAAPALAIATTTTTAPGAGGGGALPATPAGYVTVNINGTNRQIAYY